MTLVELRLNRFNLNRRIQYSLHFLQSLSQFIYERSIAWPKLISAKIDPGDTEENSATFVSANDDQIAVKVSDISRDLQRMVTDWNGLAVIMHHHRATNSWIFIAIHDVTLGPAGGGPYQGLCRRLMAFAMRYGWRRR